MSVVAGPNDIGFYLSGGSSNTNPHKSTGGTISNTKIVPKAFNNLWADVSERQARYGHKDMRVIYIKNLHSQLTFKNVRVYWNRSDNFTTMQIGRSGVNGTENTTLSLAALPVSDNPIPPSMWHSVIAADTFRIVQDFNNVDRNFGGYIPQAPAITKKGVGVEDSSATIYGQKIARISFTIVRFGDPQGPINCKIWDSSGNTIVTMGSVDSADVTQAGGVQMKNNIHTFTNQNNQHVMETGDVIGLEYPGAGIDEDSGAVDDRIIMGLWEWSGDDEISGEENAQYDIIGTNLSMWNESQGSWIVAEAGAAEVVYRAEVYGPEGPGDPGDPCEPDPGPGPDPPPGPGPEPGGFIVMQDFSDLSAQTGYQVGIGAPNNTLRQAVSIDGSNATIMVAPIARITFLLRRIGNPQGTVSCRIWSNVGVVMATLGQIEATSLTNMATQWTQAAFTLQNNSYTMKVGDLVGIEFVTGNNTDHILVAGWTWASTAAVATEGEAGQITAASDKFGVRMIYPNNGGFHYENEWEIPSDSSSMRWDFSNPPLNAEATCYFFKSSPSSDTISCKLRGGKHNDDNNEDGCCYIPQFPCTGGSMEFQIECPHPDNHNCSVSGINGSSLSMSSWHGYKVMWWNIGSPPTTVHMEAWQDKADNSGGTPVNQWEKVQVHEDSSGNCGNIDNPLFRPKGSTSQYTFRIDENSGTDYKWLSIVEIQPGGVVPGPGPGPSPPGAKDIPGTSIKRWNGTVWATNDGGNSDLVFKAERFQAGTPGPGEPPPPPEDPIIIDPGTRRKPTSYDQGIVFPPLEPGDYHALILERLVPPDPNEIGNEDVEQQIVAEIDATTEAEQPTDPGNPPPPSPPPSPPGPPPPPTPPPGPGPSTLGPYPGTGQQLGATTRRATRHYASGAPDDETIEKNTDNISYTHYQCVYYVTMHGIEHDDTVSTKLGGTHMGSGWFDHSVSFNTGKTCLGTEDSHPDTQSCIVTGASIGSILEKRVGIAAIFRRPNVHTELWTRLPGQNWVKQLENTGPLGGFDPNEDGDHEAQLRIDGFEDGDDPTIDTAVVQEISPA